MAEAIELMTLGVCGLGAVVVTGIALLHSPTKPKVRKPEQLKLDYGPDADEVSPVTKHEETILAGHP